MIGPTSVLSESRAPLSIQEETAFVLAHAYRLAYEDHLRSSVGSRVARFLHLSKPKRVTVVARIGYRLKVVPFNSREVLVSDTCSACTEKVEVVSLDPQIVADTAGGLLASVKTNEEQTGFIAQLKALEALTQDFRTTKYQSPFLASSNPLAKEIVAQLGAAESPDGSTRIVESEFEIANRPEEIRDALSNFLRNSDAYVDGLSKTRDRASERSKMMISLLEGRYPVKEELYNTSVLFEWKPPEPSKRGGLDLLKPVATLIEELRAEAKPEIDAVERENAIEKGKVEQRSNLERSRLERTYDTQIRNAERDMELEVKRLESEKDAYESQLDILESQYDDASEALQGAEEEYEELSETDSTATAQRLTDKIARLESEKDDLASKKQDVEQTLDNVESELENTKMRHAKNIDNLRDAKELAIKSHESSLKIQIAALEEVKRRSIGDKLSHVTEIEKEKLVIDGMVRERNQGESEESVVTEKFELPTFWTDRTLLDLKVGAIETLKQAVVDRVDETSKAMEMTKEFLQGHLVRLNVSAPSVTLDTVMPFWYIEIESGKQDQAVVETFVVPPSEVVLSQSETKGRSILGFTFIPTMPSVASALDSVRGYKKVRACGRSNNRMGDLDPSRLFSGTSKVMREQLVSKELLEAIHSDFKKRVKAKESPVTS